MEYVIIFLLVVIILMILYTYKVLHNMIQGIYKGEARRARSKTDA